MAQTIEKYGIEKLGKTFTTLAHLGTELPKVLNDGRISIAEGLALSANYLPKIVSILSDAGYLWKEAKDLSEEEKFELYEIFQREFDLRSDFAEEICEETVKVFLNISDYILNLSNLKTEE